MNKFYHPYFKHFSCWKLVAVVSLVAASNLNNEIPPVMVSAFIAPGRSMSAFPVSSMSPVRRSHMFVGKIPQRYISESTSALAAESFFDDLWNAQKESLATIAAALVLLVVLPNCFAFVDVGEIGVANTFGHIQRYDPGVHLKKPLVTNVECLSTKTQLLEQSNFVPTKEGLTVELDTAILVRLDPEEVLTLYRTVGTNFLEKIVTPESSSTIRGLTSESEAKALYTSGRSEIQNDLKKELTGRLGPRGIIIEDVLLKNVVLPKNLSDSIQEKAMAEQESARMEFVLKKERQEAERKAIEAEGIAEFQNIVSKGITPSVLQWKGIQATEKIAQSPNAKIVIVGNSKDSLPVILGGKD